jgi:type III restriction enzyme
VLLHRSGIGRDVSQSLHTGVIDRARPNSRAERKLAVILEREAIKWFRPAKGQFQMFYPLGSEHLEYQPDFAAETDERVYMLEPKASSQMADPDVLAKRDVAIEWCRRAPDHAASYEGKPWTYVLLPHDAIAENMTLEGLARQFAVKGTLAS